MRVIYALHNIFLFWKQLSSRHFWDYCVWTVHLYTSVLLGVTVYITEYTGHCIQTQLEKQVLQTAAVWLLQKAFGCYVGLFGGDSWIKYGIARNCRQFLSRIRMSFLIATFFYVYYWYIVWQINKILSLSLFHYICLWPRPSCI